MSEAVNVAAEEAVQDGGVQMMPVGQLVLAVKDGQVVGCEVAWNTETVPSRDHAAHALATLMSGQMDARWVLRQVARAEGVETGMPH